MSERVLVTGGGGFLGRALVGQLLERGDQVRVFSRRTFPDLTERGVECVSGDLGDAEQVKAIAANCIQIQSSVTQVGAGVAVGFVVSARDGERFSEDLR